MKGKNETTQVNRKKEQLEYKYSNLLELRKRINPRFEALRIICIYIILGGLWIPLSDLILDLLVKEADAFRRIELYKGWLYVGITGVIFYYIISRRISLFKVAINKFFEGYDELTATHEELVAMEEELSYNYDELEKHRDALEVSNQRYALAVEGSNDGIWDWDLQNDVYFFSLKWKEGFGYDNDELPDTFETWKRLLHPEDLQRALDVAQEYFKSREGIYENTYRIRAKNGEYRWVLSRGKGIWNNNGEVVRLSGSHTDITEYIKLQESLRSEKELSENIILNADMGIIVIDKEGLITKFNPFAEHITGYKEEEVLGKNVIELFIPESNRGSVAGLYGRIMDGEKLGSVEQDIICKDKKLTTVLINYSLLHDNMGNVQGLLATGVDITERRNLEKKLHSLAYHDLITQLPNRSMLEEELNKLIARAKTEMNKLAFIYLDLDNFKHINDTLGHVAGDKLLVDVANRLSSHIKHPNLVARLGGDEFAIVLNIENMDDTILEINKIFEHLKTPWILQHQTFFISASMGVAIYPDHGDDMFTLMQNADTAMFNIKESDKNGYSIYTPEMRERTLKYIEMSNELRTAIENKEFLLYYQPQIDLKTNKIIGVEALIRWMHPDKGFISPMEFIPFAEETGYINEIGDWVLKTACKQKKIWEEKGYTNLKMAINISSKTLTKDGISTKIYDILKEHNMKCSDIELEITETAIMADLEKIIETLHQFKKLNITIALDDFGTGFSSLTYLQKLPIDILKVDREFIKNIMNEDEEAYILKSVVELSHNLGLKVIAEGVETKEQLALLRRNNCNFAQGYYFSKPVPATVMEMLLKNNSESGEFVVQ